MKAHSKVPVPGLTVRAQRGDFLVEAIVAVLVSSMFGAGLIQMYTQVKRVGNMSASELLATAIASECVDHIRGLPYNFVAANLGDHFPVVSGDGNTQGDALFPYPLLKDNPGTLDYSASNDSAVVNGTNSTLLTCDPASGAQTNTIRVSLGTVAGMTGIQIQVSMAYLDSSGRHKTYVLNSVMTPNGLNG